MDQIVDLSIIIVDYKSKQLLFDCLKSLRKNLTHVRYEIIIVDNNQEAEHRIQNTDISSILPVTCYSLLATKSNRGFGSANNLGVKSARGKYLLLLNPDTLVIDDSIQKMLHFMSKHDEIGALTCLLYNDTKCNKMQKNFFGKFQSLASVTIRRYNYKKIDTDEEFFYTDIVTAAALMIKKELFNKVGGFDENIFMYLEDDDLCKCIVANGYKNAVLNVAKIIHFEGQSSTKNDRKSYYYKSQDYYWRKHNGVFPTLIMRLLRWPYKLFKR